MLPSCKALRHARLVQAARLWHSLCTPALVCSLRPRLEQLQFSRLGLLAGGGVALKGTALLKWDVGQSTSGKGIIVVDEFHFCIMVGCMFELTNALNIFIL